MLKHNYHDCFVKFIFNGIKSHVVVRLLIEWLITAMFGLDLETNALYLMGQDRYYSFFL